MIVLLPVIFGNSLKYQAQNHSRGQEDLCNTIEIMDVLDAKDTEKCRKIGIIRVESASIRVKVLRKCNCGASK